ncbi:MAG: ABC transporter ATP-binding protein [Deltaproteobacteria bacterium]|nr:ABC transporter ATP-binding protein [Deltaproteobacteria bacterium]
MKETILRTEGLTHHYSIGDRKITILDSVSLSVKSGEFVVISGSSGSGKTTLLTLLSGLDKPSKGEIWLAGQEISRLSENALTPIRNDLIGFVFQAFHLIPSLNALENIMFPAELKKDRLAKPKAEELLERVGLWERRSSMPQQLSGGEKQRVAICRALINNPRLVFADEPTGNLDSENSFSIINLLSELRDEHDTTLLMASHSSEVAQSATRILKLHDGRLTGEYTGLS